MAALISNSDGEAKREVLALPAEQRVTVDQIVAFLKSIYGDVVPLATLRSQFFTRKQRTDENIRQFALVLQELRKGSDQFDHQGRPICRHCKQVGHIERRCRVAETQGPLNL